jgi:endonuclease-3
VQTILSQHTTDAGSARAYADLRKRFPTWRELEAAPVDDVADSIRFAGLARQKATTIQTALREVENSDLHRLASMSVPDARATLTAIRGVGDKTASCVLLFALGMPAQPVDTHIERVSKRIGLTNGSRNATGIQNVFEHCLPPDGQTMYAFHVDLIRHGREICTSRVPRCSVCMMTDMCDFYAQSATGQIA